MKRNTDIGLRPGPLSVIVQAYYIPAASMTPAPLVGDRVWAPVH